MTAPKNAKPDPTLEHPVTRLLGALRAGGHPRPAARCPAAPSADRLRA